MSELLPCPFGCPFKQPSGAVCRPMVCEKDGVYAVECIYGCRGPAHESEEMAIASWNRRAASSPPPDDTEARLFATVFRTALGAMRPSAGYASVYDCAAAASAAERAVRAYRGGGSDG